MSLDIKSVLKAEDFVVCSIEEITFISVGI